MTTAPGMWRFMGVDRSHFSAKLRPAVRYKQLYCMEIPPDVPAIVEHTGVGFIPVLIAPDGRWLQDTTSIIDTLESEIPEPALIPPSRSGATLCRLLELYADEFFPTVSMRTRWAYDENRAEMQRAFAAFSGSVEAGAAGAARMNAYLPMLGVTAETIPAIDAHLDDMLAALCEHFRAQPFLRGERLSLADCALMGPLYAHLYLDRVTRRKLYDEAIEVCMWIERCNRPVPEGMGSWQLDALAPTLRRVVQLISADALPLMLAMERAFEDWAVDHAAAGAEPPRNVGSYDSELRDVPISAGVRAYTVWKLQRLRAAASGSLPPELAGLGLDAAFDAPERTTTLTKDGNRVVIA